MVYYWLLRKREQPLFPYSYYSNELKRRGHNCFFLKIHSPLQASSRPDHCSNSSLIWNLMQAIFSTIQSWGRHILILAWIHNLLRIPSLVHIGVFKLWVLSANMCTVPRAILTASMWILCLRLQEAFALINEPGALCYSGWSVLLLMLFWWWLKR